MGKHYSSHAGAGHDHGHGHNHGLGAAVGAAAGGEAASLRALLIVLSFTSLVFLAELIGGLVSGSLALVSDAMHMLSDSTGLIIAVIAIVMARRAVSQQATYGHRRTNVIAALINAATVTAVSLWIVVESFGRLRSGEVPDVALMALIGGLGLVANLAGAAILHRHRGGNMNVEGAFLHVLVDLFGSVAVLIAAALAHFTAAAWPDVAASLVIAALILPRSIALLRQALGVLLEKVPSRVDMPALRAELEELELVDAVHDLHVWSLDGQDLLATCHVVVAAGQACPQDCGVLDAVEQTFANHGIGHTTVQLEHADHAAHETVCHD